MDSLKSLFDKWRPVLHSFGANQSPDEVLFHAQALPPLKKLLNDGRSFNSMDMVMLNKRSPILADLISWYGAKALLAEKYADVSSTLPSPLLDIIRMMIAKADQLYSTVQVKHRN